ncbi:MAG: glycosyltransferase [Bacteroidota bacterium]|nr:glycosyltransferase [Bacteroidota bacterium]
MLIEIFFISLSVLYFFTHIFLYLGFKKSLGLTKSRNSSFPKVSVIVAGRNEAQNIVRCVESLAKTDYPKEFLEIILVNDNSTDNTLELMKESTKEFDFFKVINSKKSISGNLKGKANAINTAIKISTGDIIISTDADCQVPLNWINETVRYYNKKTPMVCGFTMIKFKESLFAKVQCIDWMYLLSLASSSAGLKMILSCLGNNLSFTKKSYIETGGYESIGFSVTEDLALMRKIDSIKTYDIKFPVDKECLVETQPCKNLRELFSQKRRWFRGGIGINFLGYIIGFQLYSMNFLIVFGLFFLNFKLFIALIIIKIISELILISKTFQRFNLKELYKYYPLFILYFAFYGLTLPFTFIFHTKIKWKEQKF